MESPARNHRILRSSAGPSSNTRSARKRSGSPTYPQPSATTTGPKSPSRTSHGPNANATSPRSPSRLIVPTSSILTLSRTSTSIRTPMRLRSLDWAKKRVMETAMEPWTSQRVRMWMIRILIAFLFLTWIFLPPTEQASTSSEDRSPRGTRITDSLIDSSQSNQAINDSPAENTDIPPHLIDSISSTVPNNTFNQINATNQMSPIREEKIAEIVKAQVFADLRNDIRVEASRILSSLKLEVSSDIEAKSSRLETILKELRMKESKINSQIAAILDNPKFEATGDQQQDTKQIRHLEERISLMERTLLYQLEELSSRVQSLHATASKTTDSEHDTHLVEQIDVLLNRDATGKADFALVGAGASVVREKTSPVWWGRENVSWLDAIWGRVPNPPETALSPSGLRGVGECWPCKLHACILSVRLAARIRVTHVTLEHVSAALMVRPRDEDSAPKAFTVRDDSNRLIGQFEYERNEDRLVQMFAVSKPVVTTSVSLEVQSVHGANSVSACIYRFRVHGDLVTR